MADDSYNLTIKQGETTTLQFTVTGVNLTGFTARSKGRLAHESTATTWDTQASPAVGTITFSAGTNSVVTLTLSATETAAMTRWTAGVYDIEYQSAAGIVTRCLQGTYQVVAEATRA